MIIGKKKLRHSAAGLLDKFIRRNNRVGHDWALGVLYAEVQGAGNRLELDLLHGRAVPELPHASVVARSFAANLRAALARFGTTPEVLSGAAISLVFGLPPRAREPGDTSFGDPVDATITLVSREGVAVSRQGWARCAPHGSGLQRGFTAAREAGFQLLKTVGQRSGEPDGGGLLDVLRAHYPVGEQLEFDLLHEHAVPPDPVGDGAARAHAARLRRLLGEWMSELESATLRLRLHVPDWAFAEVVLRTHDGRLAWFNGTVGGGAARHAPAPGEVPP